MSLRKETPCDFGPCPYEAQYDYTCEYYCGEPEPDDYCEDDQEVVYYCEDDQEAVYQCFIDNKED